MKSLSVKTCTARSLSRKNRDALVWETVLEFCKNLEGERHVLFLSSNKNDFGDGDNCLHSDLVEEYRALGIKDCELEYVYSIGEYVNKVLQTEFERLRDVEAVLCETQKFGNIDFQELLPEKMQEIHEGRQKHALDIPTSDNKTEVTYIGKPSLTFKNVCKLNDEIVVVTCRINVPYEVIYLIAKSPIDADGEVQYIR